MSNRKKRFQKRLRERQKYIAEQAAKEPSIQSRKKLKLHHYPPEEK